MGAPRFDVLESMVRLRSRTEEMGDPSHDVLVPIDGCL